MTISVIIPVHNGGEKFRLCLGAVGRLEPPANEVIVVADGSTDESAEIARSFGARIVSFPIAGGPARARNQGAGTATSEILLFVDADVVAPPDLIGKVAAVFRRSPSVAALFGSYDDEPAEANFFSQYKNLLHHYVHQASSEEASTFWAGCGAIRRDVFVSLGGFDERYRRPSIEDIELGYRLKQAGHEIRLCKNIQAKHLKRWTALSLLRSDLRDRALPWAALIFRERRLPNDLNLNVSSRLSALSSCGLALACAAAWWKPGALAGAALCAVSLAALNIDVYRFFYRKRGLGFTLRAIPCHWFYYLYSAGAFAGVALLHRFQRRFRRAAKFVKVIPSTGRS